MAKYECKTAIYEGGKNYRSGEAIELSADRAKALGDSVTLAATKEVAQPKENRAIKKANKTKAFDK